MFTRDRKKYTRICFGKLRGNLQAILSGEKYLKLRCQIWAQKPIGVLGLETESDSLPAQLNALFLDTAFHDVTIRVADQKIPAHKVVLAGKLTNKSRYNLKRHLNVFTITLNIPLFSYSKK